MPTTLSKPHYSLYKIRFKGATLDEQRVGSYLAPFPQSKNVNIIVGYTWRYRERVAKHARQGAKTMLNVRQLCAAIPVRGYDRRCELPTCLLIDRTFCLPKKSLLLYYLCFPSLEMNNVTWVRLLGPKEGRRLAGWYNRRGFLFIAC